MEHYSRMCDLPGGLWATLYPSFFPLIGWHCVVSSLHTGEVSVSQTHTLLQTKINAIRKKTQGLMRAYKKGG